MCRQYASCSVIVSPGMHGSPASRSTRKARRRARPKSRETYHMEDPPRVVIERVSPQIDAGRFPIKRTVGELLTVEADVYVDGQEHAGAVVLARKAAARDWPEVLCKPLGNDRWYAEFTPMEVGVYQYTLEAWPDPIAPWQEDLQKRVDAGEDTIVDLLIGANLLDRAATRAGKNDASWLIERATLLRNGEPDTTK